MELARILTGGNYPLQETALPVYDSDILSDGELMMRLSTWHSDEAKYYISGTDGSQGSGDAVDSIGILRGSSTAIYNQMEENRRHYHLTSTLASVATTAGGNFMPAIINPHATYFAYYDQTTAKNHTHAESGTAITITSIEDYLTSGYLYSTDQTDSAATNVGQLRYIAEDDGTDLTVVSYTCDTSTDFIKLLPMGHRFVAMNAAATGLSTIIAAVSCVSLELRDNYMTNKSSPRNLMRYSTHRSLNNQNPATFYGELVQLDHCYRQIVG